MRDRGELSFSQIPHVILGPDAGFPWCQSLDEWRHDVALVDARALAARAGATCPARHIEVPAEDVYVRREDVR
jgi:hypothetical protein